MNCTITYSRGLPDTVSGENLTVTYHYTTFRKDEMDKLEAEMKEKIGSGRVISDEIKILNEHRKGEE